MKKRLCTLCAPLILLLALAACRSETLFELGDVGWIVVTQDKGGQVSQFSINSPEDVQKVTERFSMLRYEKTAETRGSWAPAGTTLTWFSPEGQALIEAAPGGDGQLAVGQALYRPLGAALDLDWLAGLEEEYPPRRDLASYLETACAGDQLTVSRIERSSGETLQRVNITDPELRREILQYLHGFSFEEAGQPSGRDPSYPFIYSVSCTLLAEDGRGYPGGITLFISDEACEAASVRYAVAEGKIDLTYFEQLTSPNGPCAGREGVEFQAPEPPAQEDLRENALQYVQMGGDLLYDAQNPHGSFAELWRPWDPDQVAWALLDGGGVFGRQAAITGGQPLEYLRNVLSTSEFLRSGYRLHRDGGPREEGFALTLTLYGQDGEVIAVLDVNEARTDYWSMSGPPATPADLHSGQTLWEWLMEQLPPEG